MKRKHKRLSILLAGLLLLSGATALVLVALGDGIAYFYSPVQIVAEPPGPQRVVRLGGLVEEGSVEKQTDGLKVSFRITDLQESIPVVYEGILPDLFREGQGVVTQGSLNADGVFAAREVLAKHDENYIPREVADALKASGQWRPEGEEESQ